MKIELSIIVPVFNGEKNIERCLQSIIKQKIENYEVLVIDDGSIDNTKQIVKAIQQQNAKIKYFYQKNKGVSAARNLGISVANGEYLTFVDVDDTLASNAFELYRKYKLKFDSDVYRFNFYYSNEKMLVKGTSYSFANRIITNKENDYLQILEEIVTGNIQTFVWVLFVRSSLLKNIRFDENVSYMEDKVFYFDLFSSTKTEVFLNEPIYHYCYDDNFLHKNYDFYCNYLNNIFEVFNLIKLNIKVKQLYTLDKKLANWLIDTTFNVLFLQFKNRTNWNLIKKEIRKIKQFIHANLKESRNDIKSLIKKLLLVKFNYLLKILFYILEIKRRKDIK